MLCFHIQHGETAIHLVAKYNHANVIAAFASFKVNVNIGGKVTHTHTHARISVLDYPSCLCVAMFLMYVYKPSL